MQRSCSGAVTPYERGGERGEAWKVKPRPTVSDRLKSDAIVLDSLIAVTLTLVLASLPALFGLLYQAHLIGGAA